MSRDDLLTELQAVDTPSSARKAIADAEAYLRDHPEDLEVAGTAEMAYRIADAADRGLLPDY